MTERHRNSDLVELGVDEYADEPRRNIEKKGTKKKGRKKKD